MNMGDLAINPQNGSLNVLFYANLGDGNVRKDYQHHATLGAVDSVGTLSNTVASDLFAANGQYVVSNGTGLSVNVTAGTLQGRTFGGAIDTAAVTNLALAPNVSGLSRVDAVAISNAGKIFVVTGTPAVAQAFEVDTVATTGVPTGGTFTISFVYQGQTFTTVPIAFNATAATVATAVQGAAKLPGTYTGSGGPLTTATVTLTASGATALYGLSGFKVASNNLTGGTNPNVTLAQTTVGQPGPQAPVVSGTSQTLSTVVVANNASSPGAITNNVIPSS
jgi:hypothetical protein